MHFPSWGQKVVHFPSDNSDLLSSHFSVQSEVHYFWTASARILVYGQKQSILRACRVCRSHLSELSQPLIFCFGTLPVQRYCNQSSYAARETLSARKSLPIGRFSAATDFQLGPISPVLAPSRFSAGFSEKPARVFSQLPRD